MGRLGADAARVRTEVFIQEQAIPMEMEWDEADATALHAVVRNRLGQPLATGRLLTEAPGVGRIGRMAVIRVMRGTQLGADVLKALLAAAWARGDREVVLSAQRSAAGFYARLGFEERGPDFEEAGIAHVEMVPAALKGARPRKANPGAAPETATIPGLSRPVLAGVPGGLSPRHF
jgi:predicted GNAT family N-acyltransferase